MSYIEWVSSNGRGRLRLYNDQMIQRFDKLTGQFDGRYDNAMMVYHDRQLRMRRIVIAESFVVWEDERHVYVMPRGRRVCSSEPLSVRYTPVRRVERRKVGVFE
ncbi:MAG: hypothetical protein ACUVTL_05955 [Thermoproteota archaeon]